MPKKDRVAIYEYLFKEGVMVAKKDFHSPRHSALEKVPNLHVIKALQSLKSRGYVKEQFAWRHYYWYLTNEGIQYLRDFLNLPPEIVPPTLKRMSKPGGDGGRPPRGDREGRPERSEKPDDGADAYRRDGGYSRDRPDFKGGFGRGARPQTDA
jgi:small subunit ribosomal protein S10e